MRLHRNGSTGPCLTPSSTLPMIMAFRSAIMLISVAFAAGTSSSELFRSACEARAVKAVSSSDDLLRSACEAAGFREDKEGAEAAEVAVAAVPLAAGMLPYRQ